MALRLPKRGHTHDALKCFSMRARSAPVRTAQSLALCAFQAGSPNGPCALLEKRE